MQDSKAADYSREGLTDIRTGKASTAQTVERQDAPLLQRIAARDRAAVEEFINRHGGLIWTLAKQIADTPDEAEAATMEIFRDIYKYADRFDAAKLTESEFLVSVVRRRLLKQKLETLLDSRISSK